MDPGDWIAVYAAFVATAAVAWQAWTWRRSRKARLEVRIRAAIIGGNGTAEEVVTLDVINHSEFRVKVNNVAFKYVAEDGQEFAYILLKKPVGATLPGSIEPRDSATTWARVDRMREKGVPIDSRLTGVVTLTTGDEYTSKPLK